MGQNPLFSLSAPLILTSDFPVSLNIFCYKHKAMIYSRQSSRRFNMPVTDLKVLNTSIKNKLDKALSTCGFIKACFISMKRQIHGICREKLSADRMQADNEQFAFRYVCSISAHICSKTWICIGFSYWDSMQ